MKQLLLSLCALGALCGESLSADYRAGVARVDITPDHPIRLNGFGFRRTESEGVQQKIFAKALALDTGDGKPAVLITADVLGIPTEIHDELAKRLAKHSIKPERLAIAATHTHTAPMLHGANVTIFGLPIPKEHQANIDRYTAKFIDGLESAAVAAVKDLKPAKLSWGVGQAKFAANRRRQKIAPTDHDLPVLFVKDEKGAVRAVYLGYACHAVTLSHNKIGGDWPGAAAASIEDTFAGSVALVSIGCGADQNPNSGVTGDKVEVAAAQGREIAAEVKRLSGQFLAPITGTLTAKLDTIDLPLTDLPTRKEWEEKAKRNDAIGHHARGNLARLDRGEKLPTKVPYPIQTWTFGDSLAMVHLPGEVVVDYGLRLKAELDSRRLWVTAYANNAPCYIPSERILNEGGYEGGGAMIYYDLPAAFAPGLETKIIAPVKDQLGKPFAATIDSKKTGGTRPLSPQQSLAAIRTKPGLQVDLVAAEPLVADPVAIAFGPDGKLWVAEMADYPSGKTGKFEPGGRVVYLEDTNADGRFDTSRVFLDNLPFPSGVLPWRKGVLICAAPDILYAEDTNGDGRADKVEKLYSGFGTDNYQARVNSLQYGLDGWVYGACGLAGGTITCHRTKQVVPLGNRDFRIKPDTGELEPASGATQQGRARDDWGNWFGCDNSTLIRHYALEDHYLRRNPHVAAANVSVFVPTGPEPNRLFPLRSDAQRFLLSGPPGSVTAACGLGLYRDNLLGKDYAGNAFVCEPVNLVVHRRILKPKGATFTGSRAADETTSEFLASTDGWFRPVQVATGPDGGLWIADMYRYLIEHPRWIPPEELANVDQRAGAGLGRIYRVRPAGSPRRLWPRLDRLDTAELVAALDSPSGWQRDMAMQMLLWKRDRAANPALENLYAQSDNPVTRLYALCTFGNLGPRRERIITVALRDPSPAVLRHAIRLATARPERDAELGALLPYMAQNDKLDPLVRLQLAYSLDAASGPNAPRELASLARSGDPHLTTAAMSSLNARNLREFATAVLYHSSKTEPSTQLLRDLLATAAGVDGGKHLPDLLAQVVKTSDGTYRPWQLAAAAGALDSLRRQSKDLSKLPDETRTALAPAIAFARKLSETNNTSEADLLAAIPLLSRDPADRPDDVKRLAALLPASRPARVQTAAVSALNRLGDASVPAALVAAWSGASPTLRSLIVDSLYGRPAWRPALLAALEAGTIPPGQIEAPISFRLLTDTDAAIRARAEKVFNGTANTDRRKVIADYESALALPGDRTRGRAVFAKSCAPCHVLDGVGSAVGPDLAALANKSPRYLLGEIFDPNRNLDSRYVEYQATLADGRVVTGILASETATGLTFRGQHGKDETILRADLEKLRGTAKSLMPEGLEKDLPKQAAADLIAYLTAAEPPQRRFPGNDPAEIAPVDGTFVLPAAKAFIFGDEIVFESEFKNLGYWHSPRDHAVWKVRLDRDAAFDVYLDYACAPDSSGNLFALDGAEPTLRGTIASTGGWDHYSLVKLGTIKLPAGPGRLTFRPDTPAIKRALLDLRSLHLVPVGTTPRVQAPKPATPADLAKQILDDATPKDRRDSLVQAALPQAAAVVKAMTADLPKDAKEEYRRIPWIWRVSIAAARKNEASVLQDLLEVSLPKEGGPLADWQAVVIGGGIINGLSLESLWPDKRIAELLKDRADLARRWQSALARSVTMADDQKVPTGTRYDALRMIALFDWKTAEPILRKYLAKDAHEELQMGSVSGLVDVERPEAARHLVQALPHLAAGNRTLALAGLLRTTDRTALLLDAIEAGTAKPDWLTAAHRKGLLEHTNAKVRARAEKLLKP